MIIKILKERLIRNKIEIKDFDNKLVTFINPFSYLNLRSNPKLINSFDFIGVDGISMVYLIKFFLGFRAIRLSFDMTSLADKVFLDSIQREKTIYLVGSKQDEIEEFYKKIKNKYKSIKIVGYRNGYFNESDILGFNASILNINPDIIIVGMGVLKQETLLLDLRKIGWKGTGFTCGGFFHQTSKKLKYYPHLINKLNLRWVYRIFDEPKLFTRYFFQYPHAFVFFFKDIVNYYCFHRCKELKN